jgi:hypothetical protein
MIAATDQMHNITQTSLLHLSILFQAINLIQEIVTLSFQDCKTEVTFFRSKRVQSRVDGSLHKGNHLSQIFEQGGIV